MNKKDLSERGICTKLIKIEDPAILELPPFSELGSKTHIRRGIFGSNENYSKAFSEL